MRRSLAPLVVAVSAIVSLSVSSYLEAAVIVVGGSCTLGAAIEAANTDGPSGGCSAGSGADTIRLTSFVVLTEVDNDTDGANGLPSVISTITIDGGGHLVARDPDVSDFFRIFHVGSEGDLTIEDLVIAGGHAAYSAGGGGLLIRGSLVLRDSVVFDNRAHHPYSVSGGGILVLSGRATVERSLVQFNIARAGDFATGGGVSARDGVLEVTASIIGNNLADCYEQASGGGVYGTASEVSIKGSALVENYVVSDIYAMGAGARIDEAALVENSTISGNRALVGGSSLAYGGGLFGSGRVRQTTFVGNEAVHGAALYGSNDSVTVSGSLFANNSGSQCEGIVVNGGGNLADDSSCAAAPLGVVGLDPTLSDQGGPTPIHTLLPGSGAIDNAGSCSLATDQRGAARVPPCDSGAYEEVGCGILELQNTIIEDLETSTCSTALVGPDLVVAGKLRIAAGALITLADGFEVRLGSDVALRTDSGLLPP